MAIEAEDAVVLVEFEAMQRQLAAAGIAPATYVKGTLAIELRSERLSRATFFPVLDVLQKYSRGLSEFKHAFNGCSLVADVFSSLQRKPPRTGSAATPLPAPLEVAFSFDSGGGGSGGKVTFEKDSLLLQEELSCIVDVWRAIDREVPVVGGIAFDHMAAQLADAAEHDLANVAQAQRNGVPPVATMRQGVVAIELRFAALPREAFFPVLEILGKYVRAFTELKPGIVSTKVKADALDVSFAFETRGAGKITVQKKGLLVQEEVNAVLEVWRKLAVKQAPDDGAVRDPRAALTELGAVVFEPDATYTEARIAGYEATKRDVHETVVLPLLNAPVFVAIARLTRGNDRPSVPRAVLFEGPPGTGKTTMARVIATQAGVPMVYVPVESIMSKWFGDSERRLDAIFDLAGALDRSIVFLDEIDAFAGSRGGQMHEATRRILSVLLRQMQGLVETSNVMVVGATNRSADLDPALHNRFARIVRFPLPDQREREAIVRRYARQLDDAAVTRVAAAAEGASGRTLEDGCGAAERLWAGKLIASGAPVTAPDVDAYLAAFAQLTR